MTRRPSPPFGDALILAGWKAAWMWNTTAGLLMAYKLWG